MDKSRIQHLYRNAVDILLAERDGAGVWRGCLSSSPLATATAVFALYRVDPQGHRVIIKKGLQWLASVQNADGGWGDTDGADPSNLSTTLLCRAAFYGCGMLGQFELTINRAERWIGGKVGSLEVQSVVKAVYAIYGKDKTFAVPILTMCALAGCLGADGWRYVAPLPFELAMFPRKLFSRLNLSVVSYALPALIAIGQVKFHFDCPRDFLVRSIRGAVRNKTLFFLERLQPSNGGFLEATPLTAFVTMSLAAMGKAQNSVVQKGVEFLIRSVRFDGSWPIDTDLATWLTTLAVNALGDDVESVLDIEQRRVICDWLLRQQFQAIHPFTGAAGGGWGWTDACGAVPDADDTAGALIALQHLEKDNSAGADAAEKGIVWLLDLQNSDGGIPTFCRGWGKLPFDRSCPDITAHAIQAWMVWRSRLAVDVRKRVDAAIQKALRYLRFAQADDGGWLPLWFGNPAAKGQINPVYGTARVLLSLGGMQEEGAQEMLSRAVDFLVRMQKQDGSWSADGVCRSSTEETAIAIAALSAVCRRQDAAVSPMLQQAVERGVRWLTEREPVSRSPAAVGLYFAKLWYYERLYGVGFSVAAIRLVRDILQKTNGSPI